MSDIDFDAPIAGTAQDRDAAKLEALGLRLEEVRLLTDVLDRELSAEAWGYPQLSDVGDETQRATVSDQIRSAAHGIEDNLLEARLHELDVGELVGPNGLTMPHKDATINDHLRNDRLELHTVGFFRAFGSTLDCLAAVLIGALRIPMSLRFADMGQLARFNPDSPGKLVPAPLPDPQRAAWHELVRLLAEARELEPVGWYEWGLEARNAALHRGRGVKAFLPRRMSGRLAVVSETSPAALFRYDYYLRARPWLPDVVQLARAGDPQDVWLHEPVQATLRGLAERLTDMVSELTTWVLDAWNAQSQERTFVAPVEAWQLGREPVTEFRSFTDTGPATEFDSVVVNTAAVEHLKLAEQLRKRFAGE